MKPFALKLFDFQESARMKRAKQSADHDPDAHPQSTGAGVVTGALTDPSGRPISSVTLINDRWQVLKQLGRGGCGKVYEVLDLNNASARYAMKTESVKSEEDCGRLPQVI